MVTWAVGHLVQLAEPDAYDAKYKSWRMADLPIVPSRFKLVVRDERSRKQMSVVTRQLGPRGHRRGRQRLRRRARGRADLRLPVREGEGQEARQTAVAELDDQRRDEERARRRCKPAQEFEQPRAGGPLALGGRLDRRHERHARGHDPPAQLLRRRRLAGTRADAHAGDRGPARGGDPGLQARALLARGRDLRGGCQDGGRPQRTDGGGEGRRAGERVYGGQFHAAPGQKELARGPRISSQEHAEAIVRACSGRPGTITKLEKKEQREKAPMLYDLTTLQREANTRYGFSARRTLAAAQRLYEEHKALTYPRTNSRYLTTDMVEEIKPIAELVGIARGVPRGRRVRDRPRRAAAGPRGQRREGHRPPRDHPHPLRAQAREDGLRRPAHLRHGRAALLGRLPPRGRVREHARGDDRRRRRGGRPGRLAADLPHPRQGAARARLARRLRRGARDELRAAPRSAPTRTRRPPTSSCRGWRRASPSTPARSRARARKPNRRGATATRRCSARWRPPASSSTTTSCARR